MRKTDEVARPRTRVASSSLGAGRVHPKSGAEEAGKMTKLTDDDLAEVLRQRDPSLLAAAWREWQRRHGARARAVAGKALRRYGVAADLAEDAVQHGSLMFLLNLDRLDPD